MHVEFGCAVKYKVLTVSRYKYKLDTGYKVRSGMMKEAAAA